MKRIVVIIVAVLATVGWISYTPASVEAFTGVNELVSVDSSEVQGNGHAQQYPSISQDGRYVVFRSAATNLVAGDTNGAPDIFLRDRTNGTTTRITVSSAGVQGNGASFEPRISKSGRYIVYASHSTNLDGGSHSGMWRQIYMYDRVTGTNTFISQSTTGGDANDGSGEPDVSSDGRFVTFQSRATNLVSGGVGGTYHDIYVRDTVLGTTKRLTTGNNDSLYARIDCSGRFVAFESAASNVVAGDTNATNDAFLADLLNGTSITNLTGSGNSGSGMPVISCNGNYVALMSLASNLVPSDTNSAADIFRYDRLSGDFTLASLSGAGAQANNSSGYADISGDGRYLAFHTDATNLATSDTNSTFDVVLRDMIDGTTQFVAGSSGGAQANNANMFPSISADGKFITYLSQATNLAADTNGKNDMFVSTTGEEACTF